MAQFFLETLQWHCVKRGDAFAFCAGDIRVRDRIRSARAAAIWGTGDRGHGTDCIPGPGAR